MCYELQNKTEKGRELEQIWNIMGLWQRGLYVLDARLTRVDGQDFDPLTSLKIGQCWRWGGGDAVRLDGPPSSLLLEGPLGADELHRRVSRVVRRKLALGAPQREMRARSTSSNVVSAEEEPGFVIADGETQFRVVPIQSDLSTATLLWCPDGIPLRDHDYRITQVPTTRTPHRHSNDFGGDVICFTQGTRICCEAGERRVEDLTVGDKVQTKDNGVQELLWVGRRRMTGARLYAMPTLRPVRVRSSALGSDVPDADLLVSPHHRMVIGGRHAQALFNQPEVLVSAHDLIDNVKVFVDHAVKEVTYFHLLLADHNILWANGLMTESYHPANTTLKTVDAEQRALLLALFPDIKRDPYAYGPFARRNLDTSEAAILRHAQAA